jgi:predicted nucleic acid-binding protein
VIVADASTLVVGVVDPGERGRSVRRLLDDGAAAPQLVDAEVGQALRGLVLRGRLAPDAGLRSLRAAQDYVTGRHAPRRLTARAWELRHNVSFYDGLYVALAEALDVPLVTADGRLGAATGPRCAVRLV